MIPVDFTRRGNVDFLGSLSPVEDIFQYGTAGFRCPANKLGFVCFRVGAVAAMRAKYKQQAVAVMVTASHNPSSDNGVKIIDPMGEMLDSSWETTTTTIVNANDSEFAAIFRDTANEIGVNLCDEGGHAAVFVGYDNRASSLYLSKAIEAGSKWVGVSPISIGMVTTPQLHFIVRCHNYPSYGTPSIDGYIEKMTSSFLLLNQGLSSSRYRNELVVDASNGVGGPKLLELASKLGKVTIQFHLVNNGDGELNFQCGADYVKLHRSFPLNCEMEAGIRCCSFDGDADRIVYFYKRSDGVFRLLDGDKIALLFADYIIESLTLGGIDLNRWKLAVVQTAYANGASTKFIRDRGLNTKFVPTGVKHLHHEAQQYDVGIYFEANGHGTILFSDAFKRFVNDSTDNEKMNRLRHFINLTNETVGDAIADMLLVESILNIKNWTIQDWDSQYEDMASRQLKVVVSDRRLVKTVWDETSVISPPGLQSEIDSIVNRFGGRAFVRPSGTEDVVRIYAESSTPELADKIAKDIELAIKRTIP